MIKLDLREKAASDAGETNAGAKQEEHLPKILREKKEKREAYLSKKEIAFSLYSSYVEMYFLLCIHSLFFPTECGEQHVLENHIRATSLQSYQRVSQKQYICCCVFTNC